MARTSSADCINVVCSAAAVSANLFCVRFASLTRLASTRSDLAIVATALSYLSFCRARAYLCLSLVFAPCSRFSSSERSNHHISGLLKADVACCHAVGAMCGDFFLNCESATANVTQPASNARVQDAVTSSCYHQLTTGRNAHSQVDHGNNACHTSAHIHRTQYLAARATSSSQRWRSACELR